MEITISTSITYRKAARLTQNLDRYVKSFYVTVELYLDKGKKQIKQVEKKQWRQKCTIFASQGILSDIISNCNENYRFYMKHI